MVAHDDAPVTSPSRAAGPGDDDTATRPAVGSVASKAKDVFGAAREKATAAASAVGAAAASATGANAERPNAERPNAERHSTAATTRSAATSTTTTRTQAATRRTRKARLRLTRIDPWSVMKTSFLFGIAGGIILFISVWVLWGVIGASGVFESVNKAVNDLVASPGGEQRFRLEDYLNTNKILGFTAMIAAADVVIFTALATLFSFLYNLSATVLGGLEVTLAED
ncbi:DUF3566 domain-containing protein [Aestuariimicrobium ganziense]|uniref:DUF3566 domain-containing protein n=1 Tax=Aestuariimicrobium ganziense TaxID=2773677 RepID=UPI0038B22F19